MACQEVLKCALNEPKYVALHLCLNIISKKLEKKLLISYAKQPMENHGGPTPCEKSH